MSLFVGLRKFGSHGDGAKFEGSFGYAGDMVTKGWQRAAHRDLDLALSTDWMPVHTHKLAQPLTDGEVLSVDVALLPQATRFRKGERLRPDLRGSWHFPTDPLRGQFPANYEASIQALCTVHTGGQDRAALKLGWRDFTAIDGGLVPSQYLTGDQPINGSTRREIGRLTNKICGRPLTFADSHR